MKPLSKLLAAVCSCCLLTIASTSFAQENLFRGEPAARPDNALPLSDSSSLANQPRPLTYPQQVARFAAQQRVARIEFNRSIGYTPLRPTVNESVFAYSRSNYYMPATGGVYSPGYYAGWYW